MQSRQSSSDFDRLSVLPTTTVPRKTKKRPMSRVMRGTVVVGSTDSLSKSEELWRLCIQHSESQDLCRAPLRVDLGQDPRLPAPWRTFRFANLDFQLWRCGVQGRPAFILRVMQ